MTEGRGRSLTRRDFDAVIRRAAELAASDPEPGTGGLTEAEVFRIAGEVGLPEHHVRRALTEVRSGLGADGGVLDRIFGPSIVQVSRAVPGTPEDLAGILDEFFVATQLLQPMRRGPDTLQYRPAVDWASQLARAASFTSRKYYVASAKLVDVTLEPIDEGRTEVMIQIDPGTRGDSVGAAIMGGGAGAAASGIGSGVGLMMVAPFAVAVAVGAVVGAGVWSWIAYWNGRSHKSKVMEVRSEAEGILDCLELGESLEPPPASWLRWVKRQFHGVAHEMVRFEEESDG